MHPSLLRLPVRRRMPAKCTALRLLGVVRRILRAPAEAARAFAHSALAFPSDGHSSPLTRRQGAVGREDAGDHRVGVLRGCLDA